VKKPGIVSATPGLKHKFPTDNKRLVVGQFEKNVPKVNYSN